MNSFRNQTGQIFILSIIVLTLVMINTVLIIGNSLTFNQSSKYSLQEVQAITLAEAGIDKAIASFNQIGSSYNGESETPLSGGSYSVEITDKDATTKILKAIGYIPNKSNAKVKRTVQLELTNGEGVSFVYGMQIGNGGLNFGNGGTFNGSLYSNGNITGGNGNTITGDVWVAGGAESNPNQQSSCSEPNCQDFVFGKNVGGNNQLDVAQSFKPDTTAILNKVVLKLKKFGSPPNLTVRILGDNNNKPNKNNVIASGTLASSLVTTTYGEVDITFSSSPSLSADTPYWIMLDTSSNSTNYWAWANDTTQGYTRGSATWSPNWQASSPVWNTISGDLDFKAYMGGVTTGVNLGGGSVINGDVHANTIQNVTVKKDAYYQTIINSTVEGTSYPGSPDPPPVALPISDANINNWKSQAEAAGVTTGNLNGDNGCLMTLGPRKIVGNLTLGNGCTVTIKSPLWITGNITAGNSTIFKLDTASGSSSGLIIVDGTTVFGNGVDIRGSGTAGSYLMLLSTYNTQTQGEEAIDVGNGAVSGIFYAPFGEVNLPNGASFKEIVAWKIDLGNTSVLSYESGLSNVTFSSGPTGSYSIIKGSYQVK